MPADTLFQLRGIIIINKMLLEAEQVIYQLTLALKLQDSGFAEKQACNRRRIDHVQNF